MNRLHKQQINRTQADCIDLIFFCDSFQLCIGRRIGLMSIFFETFHQTKSSISKEKIQNFAFSG